MALQINYQSQYGVTATEAYARIERFRGDKNYISCDIQVFYNVAARENNLQSFGYIVSEMQIADGATMEQMYAALKLLPEFEGAIDV